MENVLEREKPFGRFSSERESEPRAFVRSVTVPTAPTDRGNLVAAITDRGWEYAEREDDQHSEANDHFKLFIFEARNITGDFFSFSIFFDSIYPEAPTSEQQNS